MCHYQSQSFNKMLKMLVGAFPLGLKCGSHMFHELKSVLVENFFHVIIIALSIEKPLVAMKTRPMAFGLGY
jgi:hypothetical protein